MKYSIIVATYNRLEELQELIPSIDEQTYDHKNFELLIIDDGSTDETESYLSSHHPDYEHRYFKQDNKGPGAARNLGMSEAKGEYFLFVDSDCILPPEYLQAIDTSLEENHWDAFGGPDTYHESFTDVQKAINYSMTSFIGTGGARGSKKSVTKFYPRSFNMGISREVYEKIGGMNDLRHGQDMDLSARIYEAGFKVGFIPEAFVYHKRRSSLRKFFNQVHNWGVARVNLGSAHKGMFKPIHIVPSLLLLGTIAIPIMTIMNTAYLPVLAIWVIIIGVIGKFASVQSFLKYKNVKAAGLSVIALYIQVIAYAIGVLNGLVQKLFGAKEAKGITKKYYG